jgi:hypothetical protein
MQTLWQTLWQDLRYGARFKQHGFTWLAVLMWLFLTSVGAGWSNTQTSDSEAQAFTNGKWFDGASFKATIVYAVNGRLTWRKPKGALKTIDLRGGYVAPPFGEAHNHNVESPRIERVIKMYLEGGVFYVKNPNSLLRLTTPLRAQINQPASIDVIFAGAGLTGAGGHPVEIVQRNVSRKIWTEADGEGAFYFTLETRADLERKWEQIKAARPDFIKTHLLYAEEYDKRKADAAYFGWRGLDPMLLPEIVKRAHREGLRVSTHVESAADFHYAVRANVDEINHLPGFRPDRDNEQAYADLARYEIKEADARATARQGIFVVTTIGDLVETLNRIDADNPKKEFADKVKGLLVRNLRLLHRHKVRLALGSDSYGKTAVHEALQLHALQAFDNLTLLKMWCENTAAAIFPNRKIGYLREGYEASFLALGGDPLADFSNVRKIELRVKQGALQN